jgi:hypothetical protein
LGGVTSGGLDFGDNLVSRPGIVTEAVRSDPRVIHDYGGSLDSQFHRLCAAYAAPRTRHNGDLPLESLGHWFPPSDELLLEDVYRAG